MDRSSVVARLATGDLYVNVNTIGTTPQLSLPADDARLAAAVPAPDDDYEAVSLDPTSDFRVANVFLDEDPTPWPLVGGEILRARFRRLRVLPFLRTTWDSTVTPSGVFTTQTPFNTQKLALRLWREAPQQTHVQLPDVIQLHQRVLTTQAGGALNDVAVFHLHAPGARSITFFAGNHNTGAVPAAAGNQPVSIYGCRPERPPDDPLSTSITGSTFSRVIATLTFPMTAAQANQSATITDPGFTEYFFVAHFASATSAVTYEVGCIIHFNTP